MLERNVTVTLEKAKEWYNSGNESLREIALQAFSKEELKPFDFTRIKTFEDALDALGYCCLKREIKKDLKGIRFYSRASAAMFQLNIIRKALNKSYDLHLTKRTKNQDYIWYPCLKFITEGNNYYSDTLQSNEYKKIGKFESEGVIYNVLGGQAATNNTAGLGYYYTKFNTGDACAHFGFLGCATREIAKHFSEYFGMLIMEAMYSDMVDFKRVEE